MAAATMLSWRPVMLGRTGVTVAAGLWACVGISSCLAACGDTEGGRTSTGANGAGASAGSATGTAGGGSATGGSATSGGKSSGGAASAIEAYPAEYAKAVCAVLDRCWPSFLLELAESCEAYIERTLREGGFAHVVAAVSDGRTVYDANRAQVCLEAFASQSCEDGLGDALGDWPGVRAGE